MELTQDQIDRIRRTWSVALTAGPQTAQVFYAALFRIAPATKPLFKSDLEAQGAKLTDTLTFVVDHLDDMDAVLPAAKDLAIRHVSYGVTAKDYPPVGAALIEAFETLMGSDFSSGDRSAWIAAYDGLSAAMIDTAYPLV